MSHNPLAQRPNRVSTQLEGERFYAIVPETAQTSIVNWSPEDSHHPGFQGAVDIKNTKMVAGRLIAQGIHVGRMIGHVFQNAQVPYRDITTIVLSVRNSKELRKVSDEIHQHVVNFPFEIGFAEFHDENPDLYLVPDKVHTITLVGPVLKEELESAIGHLELYGK